MKIYLAGPISGQNYKEATNWRQEVIQAFEGSNIGCYSPMRGKEYLKNEQDLTFKNFGHPMSTTKGIMGRDFNDATTSDLLLINFDVEHPSVSLGTVMEIAWAYQQHKPVICIDSPKFKYSKHPMIAEAVTMWAKDLPEAIKLARLVLLPK